jgi:hypothetical protein
VRAPLVLAVAIPVSLAFGVGCGGDVWPGAVLRAGRQIWSFSAVDETASANAPSLPTWASADAPASIHAGKLGCRSAGYPVSVVGLLASCKHCT